MAHRLTEPQSRLVRALKKAGTQGVEPDGFYKMTVQAVAEAGMCRLETVYVPTLRLVYTEPPVLDPDVTG